jgi:ankyrin repeat protein
MQTLNDVLGAVFAYLFPECWEKCHKTHIYRNLSELVEDFPRLKEAEIKYTENDRFTHDIELAELDIQEALEQAIQTGNIGLLRSLLRFRNLDLNKATLRLTSGHIVPPLCAAAASGYVDIVELLAEDDRVDVNQQCELGPALSFGISHQHIGVVRAIIANLHVELNPRGPVSYELPLRQAVELGNEAIVKTLLDSGVDRNSGDALILAIENRKKEIVQLLAEDSKANHGPDLWGSTTLSQAIRSGSEDIIAILLRVPGMKINLGSPTALWAAVRLGKLSIVESLLQMEGINANLGQLLRMEGIDADLGNGESRGWISETAPLTLAVRNGRTDIVRLLLRVPGILLKLTDYTKLSPLRMAAWKGYDKIVKLLLQEDTIDVNYGGYGPKTQKKLTPLELAVAQGHDSGIRLLIERHDVHVNCQNYSGKTAVQLAAEAGTEKVVALLLQTEGIDVNYPSGFESIPLLAAAEKGHTEGARLLLQAKDINVNISKSPDGKTPLFAAAEKGHTEVVRLLLQAKDINVNASASRRRYDLQSRKYTPLVIAIENGHKEVVRLLQQAMGIEINDNDI